ncbi:MAG TPA: hypothetical protein VFZ09_50065 [Archangium sp.]|uniref:hypothetical protein n=1 Tax=Archangium sp. TaxID=1872627 RepID=UPI002E330E24|nr:hypothetical protein [Archangium sp.]HEX5754430.1 hypothetical protein [Archangium sp.]
MNKAIIVLAVLFAHPAAHAQPHLSWGGQHAGARPQFNQSCGAACGAPINASTGEIIAPGAVRAGQVLETVIQATEALQGFITVSKFLDETQKKAVEEILVACVKEANTKVDDELFGKGRSLPDSECGKQPTVREKLAPTWRRHLGKLKHAAAFECIQRRLSEKFPDNVSIEPRLRKDELTKEVLLTDRWDGSLQPDIVIHFTRNITRVQCIYDLKFPCGYDVGSNPWTAEVVAQMTSYARLGGECLPALITPQRAIVRQ